MKIIYHNRITVDSNLCHIVIVENPFPPTAYEIACLVNYHPEGYTMKSEVVTEIGFNSYLVTWVSWNNCD